MCHITSKSYVISDVCTVNVQFPSGGHRAHHCGHPRCPRAPSLYITVWRRMGALAVSVHKGRQAGANSSQTQNMCHITPISYMKSDSVIVNVRTPSGRHRAHTCVEPLSPRGARICTLPFGDAWAPWWCKCTKAVRPEPNDPNRQSCAISLPNLM